MLVYISEPIMLRKNFLAIYHISLALQRALSLCFDTTLSFQAIAMISLGILHINLALQKYCRSYFTPQASLENAVIEPWGLFISKGAFD